jgi:tRNA A-37 threonylcarbamoyl transferase component Bud32
MAWAEITPHDEPVCRQHGWQSADSFFALTGVLVNRHRHRQVEMVEADGNRFFLKSEFAVTWRDRFRNAWSGFGWSSTAVREAKLLRALRKAGIGCPDLVACGEDQARAFVLLREAPGMAELRTVLQSLTGEPRHRLAEALGQELARMHDAGFDHHDLFAKHILAGLRDGAFRFCLLDWQRGQQRRTMSWRQRCRNLAVLDATLHGSLANDRLRLRCLRAYLSAVAPGTNPPPLRRLASHIRREAEQLQQKRQVREIRQLPVPPAQQEFVPLCDGQLLVVRAYYEELGGRVPEWLLQLPHVEHDGPSLSASEGQLLVTLPFAGAQTRTSYPLWELPPLTHILFRLHRFGVPAPRLLAVGRSASQLFVLMTAPATIPWQQAVEQASASQRSILVEQADRIIRQVSEAGYSLPPGESWPTRLGVHPDTGKVIFATIEPLQTASLPSPIPLDIPRRKRQAIE